jgi:hypothetical protein
MLKVKLLGELWEIMGAIAALDVESSRILAGIRGIL